MIQSSLSAFTSQFKSESSSKKVSSQGRARRISGDQEPSPDHGDQVNHVDPSEGEKGELASEEDDPNWHQGDPNLTQLVMTAEEQRDYDSFAGASLSVHGKRGKTPFLDSFPGEF